MLTTVVMFTASGLLVRYLKVFEKSGGESTAHDKADNSQLCQVGAILDKVEWVIPDPGGWSDYGRC